MEIKHIYTEEQKKEWLGDGKWVNEPDEVLFEHVGLKCEVKRVLAFERSGHAFGGHLCGYVTIPEGHQLYNVHGQWDLDVDVHGGITFARDNVIGFDCAHAFDLMPSLKKLREKWEPRFPSDPALQDIYRNMDFAITECKKLAEQLSNYKNFIVEGA